MVFDDARSIKLLVRADDFVFEFAFSASRTSTSHPNVVYVITAHILAQTIILLNQLELFAFGHLAYRHCPYGFDLAMYTHLVA
jgi:hypothetical protein